MYLTVLNWMFNKEERDGIEGNISNHCNILFDDLIK